MAERLKYHFEPQKGWINDPNGLIFYKGRYHAFFQHYPYAPKWGTMHWGHAVSDDLIHWEELPIALYPDQPYEQRKEETGGCWSGSAVIKDDLLYLIYTSVSDDFGQTQSVAVSKDGVHFEKYENNPVIKKYPPDGGYDFRDPKVTKIGDIYYMVLGSGKDNVGKILLYSSENLYDWKYIGVMFEGKQYGRILECPDFFPFNDKYILMFSQMGRQTHSVMFIYGDFDGKKFTPISFHTPEAGPHFYAPQTFLDEKGRRIIIGWLNSWGNQANAIEDYVGALSIPRELQMTDGKLYIFPVSETADLLKNDDELIKIEKSGVTVTADALSFPLEYRGKIERVDILRDTKTIEIFINNGEASFTYWYGTMDSIAQTPKYYPEIVRTAKTESGVVRGIPCGNPIYTVYKGIQYAAPPVGDLRWKAPQPVKTWEGELKADTFASIAPQGKSQVDSFYGKEFFQSPERMSEDCLYLNIWTPAKTPDEKLPVLFWIHGGGCVAGYGNEPEFDGEAFCCEGVILVTFNYRLGILGFYTHPELTAEGGYGASGNYAHLDQAAALKWVRKNIAAFGGDPDKITIFGQSAGAMSVQALVNSQLTKGDIKGAIVMSGASVGMLRGDNPRGRSLADAEESGKGYMEAAGCNSISELRKLSYEELMDVPGVWDKFRTGPIIDGYFLKQKTDEGFFSGNHQDVAYMFGNTADEGAPEHKGMTANRILAEVQLKHNRKPAYLYNFNRKLPGDEHGAFHSSELWYVFGTIGRCWRPMTGIDYDLSLAMTKYWANFAKNHNPNGDGLPEWSPYTKDSRKNMILGEKIYLDDIEETSAQKADREEIIMKIGGV